MITLVLGASGVGQSRVAVPLAAPLSVPLAKAGRQRDRALDSIRIRAELARRAHTEGVPIIPARPCPAVLDRVLAAL